MFNESQLVASYRAIQRGFQAWMGDAGIAAGVPAYGQQPVRWRLLAMAAPVNAWVRFLPARQGSSDSHRAAFRKVRDFQVGRWRHPHWNLGSSHTASIRWALSELTPR